MQSFIEIRVDKSHVIPSLYSRAVNSHSLMSVSLTPWFLVLGLLTPNKAPLGKLIHGDRCSRYSAVVQVQKKIKVRVKIPHLTTDDDGWQWVGAASLLVEL